MPQVQRSPPVLSALNWCARLPCNKRVPCEVVGERRFFHPREALFVKRPQSLDSLCWSEALVVVHHNVHVSACRLAHGAHHCHILLHRRVADFSFDAREALPRPAFGSLRTICYAVISDWPIGADRLLYSTQ